jgi:hypothetical protein
VGGIGVSLASVAAQPPAAAKDKDADLDKRVEAAVERGLEWLKRNQARDGSWSAQGGQYRVAMTALAGMAFLMEGSNLKEGKYSDQLQKAMEWFLAPARLQANGLIGDAAGGNFGSYMHGHGYALMFLACLYGEEEDPEQRARLERAIKKAVDFTCKAQTSKKHRKPEGKEVEVGGWGYVSATERNNFDEGSVTVTQLQALRAARNAGIAVPKESIDKAIAYLEACTTPKGGIIYSYANSGGVAMAGQERPPLTCAAVTCGFSAGQYNSELAKKWIKFCKDHIPIAQGRHAHDEYQSYYFAQMVYILGDDRYGQLFPNEPKENWLTWSKYKKTYFPYLLEQQSSDGSWTSGYIGPVFTTSVNLAILQLEKGILPLYQR